MPGSLGSLDAIVSELQQHWERWSAVHGALDAVGWLGVACGAAGGLLVLVSAFVRTMIPLRWLAVGSSIGFIVYGLLVPAPLVAVLHAMLLPINLWRVRDMTRLTRRALDAGRTDAQLAVWLKPYMRKRTHRAGRVLFRRGDTARRLYYLVDGSVELPEVGRTLGPGQMFGELAFFAADRRRSSSAVCRTRCLVMSIDEDTFRQVCLQNPDFGYHVTSLVAARLGEDLQRLQAGAAAAAAAGPGAAAPAAAAAGPDGRGQPASVH